MHYYQGCAWEEIMRMPLNIFLMLYDGMVYSLRQGTEEGRKVNRGEDLAIERKHKISPKTDLSNLVKWQTKKSEN